MAEEVFRFQKFVMDIGDSIDYDKEIMLAAMVKSSGLTPAEFGRDYILDEYPIEIITQDNILNTDHQFVVTQKFRVRLKTDAERQLEIESKEKNDDSK